MLENNTPKSSCCNEPAAQYAKIHLPNKWYCTECALPCTVGEEKGCYYCAGEKEKRFEGTELRCCPDCKRSVNKRATEEKHLGDLQILGTIACGSCQPHNFPDCKKLPVECECRCHGEKQGWEEVWERNRNCGCTLGEMCSECSKWRIVLASELTRAREEERKEVLEEIWKWAVENGITHKPSFVALRDELTRLKPRHEK